MSHVRGESCMNLMNFKKRRLLFAVLTALLLGSAAAGQENAPRPLSPEQTIEREIFRENTHVYDLNVKKGEFNQIRVEQKSFDVLLSLYDAKGGVLAKMSTPTWYRGREILSFIADETETYRLEISSRSAVNPRQGVYSIKLESGRKPTPEDRKRIALERIFDYSSSLCFCQRMQYEQRLQKLHKALTGWQELKDDYYIGVLLRTIALYYQRPQPSKALEFFNQALLSSRKSGDKFLEAFVLKDIGHHYWAFGEEQKALEISNQALALFKADGDTLNYGSTLNDIALVHEALGEKKKALEIYNQALDTARLTGVPSVKTSNNAAHIYMSLGEYQKALELSQEALKGFRKLRVIDGEGRALYFIGRIYSSMGETEKALDYYEQALVIHRKIGDRFHQSKALNSIGDVHYSSGDYRKAIEFYNQALPVAKTFGDHPTESLILKNQMKAWNSLNEPDVAIFYGKQSINKYQKLRQSIQGLDKETQKTYLGTIEDTYKQLAEILIAQGRIIEAEQVLRMIKQEEIFEYLRGDSTDIDKLAQRADLTTQEAAAIKRFNEIIDEITALGVEFGELKTLLAGQDTLTQEQENRYNEVSDKLEDANRVFLVFLRHIDEEFAKRTNTKRQVEETLGLQSDLKAWGKDVVFLYTLVGEDRFRTILVTPETRTNRKTEITAAELNKKIFAFRQVVQDPKVDPRSLGKELYDILIKPMESDLEGAGAKTLLWSLDGNLRSLPLAALWDGERYFGQKYRNVVVTLASRTRLGDTISPNLRALGFGVSESKSFNYPDGKRSFTSTALPAVPDELAAIIRTAKSPNGIMPGQAFLNAEFTKNRFKRELVKSYPVVHIASHFSLNPGDATRSFLLLGDGELLTLDEIRTSPQLQFNGVELLTLSACQTAVTGDDSTGKEIEGFGYVAQQNGAEAILATLWPVADRSTQKLMTEFYRLRKEDPQMTKAEAMQIAQTKMIEGEFEPISTAEQRTSRAQLIREKGKSKNEADDLPYYSHPYYWAPFILIGNWK